MSRPNVNDERAREAAQARADLERRAEESCVVPFDAEEWLAESESVQTPEEAEREVEEFLSVVRRLRDAPSDRSLG